ncbi:MAG: SIS domain-containing protein [Magnetococcales bacterium]|nr:SIS domain-containing protein [Magnetococcales bacterium]
MNPTTWLEQLHQAILSTRCRTNGQEVSLADGMQTFDQLLRRAMTHQQRVWWVGNGGSAALCAHLSQDILNKLGIASHTLTDASLITCMANDFGYESVYYRPLSVLARPTDLLIAISSSGRSENILRCVRWAQEQRLSLVTLSSMSEDNPLWQQQADVAFYLPTHLYGHAEVGHEALLHGVIETVWLSTKDRHPPL